MRLYRQLYGKGHAKAHFGAACAVLFALAGCSAAGGLPPSPRPTFPLPLRAGEIIETATGRIIDWNQLAARLSKVAIVYVGETHTSVEDHRVQLEILKRLSRGGGCVRLGMEMVPAEAQPVLDRYIAGEMSEREFLKEVRWDEVWGFPYSLYKGLIDWQKRRRMPVAGLNAPNSIVRKIARHGLGSLTTAQRSRVARVFHLDDPADRERVEKAFKAHGKFEIKDFQSFFEAQLAWEETMAQTLARLLDRSDCQILVILGKGHINKRYGVPHLTLLRRPNTTFCTVVPLPLDSPPDKITPNLADYVVITGKSKPVHHPRLGVLLEPAASGAGVRIAAVLPGTPAAAAHLQKGDIILSIDGVPVKTARDVLRALGEAGTTCRLLLRRNNAPLTVALPLPP